MGKPGGIFFPEPESKGEIDDDDACNQISTDRKTKDRSDESRDILTEKN